MSDGGAVVTFGICTWPIGTDGMMIPRDAAADRSNTYGTVGCSAPFTAGPGVIARVSTVGALPAKIAIGK